MGIRQYIAQTEKTYHYRVKTIVPLTDEALDFVEKAILKYLPIAMSRPTKTMLQRNPLDFPQVQNAEVYMIDLELGLPVGSAVLHDAITKSLGTHGTLVVVRGENDPTEIETQTLNAKADAAEKAGDKMAGALLNSPTNEEVDSGKGEEVYGDAYNKRFVDVLAKVQKERAEASKVEAQSPLFTWMDVPKRESQEPVQDDTDFNAGQRTTTGTIGDGPVMNSNGGFNDENRVPGRIYKTTNGKLEVVKVKTDPIKKN